jgi:hypothetical protein
MYVEDDTMHMFTTSKAWKFTPKILSDTVNINYILTNCPTPNRNELLIVTPNAQASTTACDTLPYLYVDSIFASNLPSEPCLLSIKVTLDSTQIRNSYTSPITLIPNPGINKFIEVISIYMLVDSGSVAYQTNTTLKLYNLPPYTTTVNDIYTIDLDLLNSTNYYAILKLNFINEIRTNINEPLVAATIDGNPENGNGQLTFYINYKIKEF